MSYPLIERMNELLKQQKNLKEQLEYIQAMQGHAGRERELEHKCKSIQFYSDYGSHMHYYRTDDNGEMAELLVVTAIKHLSMKLEEINETLDAAERELVEGGF